MNQQIYINEINKIKNEINKLNFMINEIYSYNLSKLSIKKNNIICEYKIGTKSENIKLFHYGEDE